MWIMNFKGVFKGTILAFIIAAFCLFVSSILVYYNLMNERVAGVVVFAGAACGCFLGALANARTSESKILFNALFIGIIFSLVLLITSAIVNGGFKIHTRTGVLILSSLCASFAGALFSR